MLRYLVVQPLFHVDVPDDQPAEQAECHAHGPTVGEAVGANGQFLALIFSMIQKAAANLPAILPELLALLPLLAKPQGTVVGEAVGANGQFLTALANLLTKASETLPTILPEILQLISLFGGKVQVTPPAA